MNLSLLCGPPAQAAASGLISQPAVLAAIATLAGVLLTVIANTFGNFRLAKQRNEFEKALAERRFQTDKELAIQKLDDERRARADITRETAKQKRIEFQRSTLLDLQESMNNLVRNGSQIQLNDMKNSRDAGKWVKIGAPSEISDEGRRLQAKTHMLISRVHDGDIRDKALRIKSYITGITMANDEEQSREALREASVLSNLLNQDVGETLRHLDAEE